MLRKLMRRWPDESLRRVIDRPIEGWADGSAKTNDAGAMNWPERGCLYQIAGDTNAWYRATVELDGERKVLCEGGEQLPPFRYDALVKKHGLPRVVALIKQSALNILLERHPLPPSHLKERPWLAAKT